MIILREAQNSESPKQSGGLFWTKQNLFIYVAKQLTGLFGKT